MYQERLKIHLLSSSGCGNREVAKMITSHLSCSTLVTRCRMKDCFFQENTISIPNLHCNTEVLCTVDCCPATLEHRKNMERDKTKASSPEGQTLTEFIQQLPLLVLKIHSKKTHFKMIKKWLERYNNIITRIDFLRSYCVRVSLFLVSLHKNMEDRIFFVPNSLEFKL